MLHHYSRSNYDTDAAALLAVALPPGGVSGLRVAEEEWEDLCRESGGWEFVDGAVGGERGGRNEYGGTWPVTSSNHHGNAIGKDASLGRRLGHSRYHDRRGFGGTRGQDVSDDLSA